MLLAWCKMKCVMQCLGTKWFCISDFGWRRWSGAPPLDRLPAKAEGARSIHRWLRMHRPLTWFSPPAEAVYRGVATVIPNSFLGARSESWVLGEDQCSRPSRGMLLSGLQRYYLSPHTQYTARDAAVRFTKVLPLSRHPVHPKGCCCGVYKGTTSPHTPRPPQRMLQSGFTKVLNLLRHPVYPKGCCCRVYKGTTSPHTPRPPQRMLL